MKMDLEYPYNKDWKFGYLQINPEMRKTVILFNNSQERSSTAYARYLLAVKLGRYLTEYEEADHIDTDKTNDSIDNLQVLSVEEHRIKTNLEQSGETYLKFICACCGEEFTRSRQRINKATKYCGLSCARKSSKPPINDSKRQEVVLFPFLSEIRELVGQGFNDRQIADKYGSNRSTVFYFRNQYGIKGRNQSIKEILKDNSDMIVSMYSQGETFNAIAKRFGVDKKVINRFIKKTLP